MTPHAEKAASRGATAGRERASARMPAFTDREREVLQLLVGGCANRHIAATLVLSVRTVESHVASICGKLGVRSRGQAAAAAIALGIASPAPKSPLVAKCETVNGIDCIP